MKTTKMKKLIIRKFKNVQAFTPVLVVGLLIATGAVIYNFNASAATAGFYFTSGSNAYKLGDSISVGVYEDSNTDCANVVEADFTYPANLLRYDGYSATGSKYESSAPSSTTSGKVGVTQYTSRKECGTGGSATSGVSGAQLIGTVSFTVVGTGSATLSFQSSTIAISAADNKTDVAPGRSNKTFTLSQPVTPPTPPTPPATPPPPPATPPTPPANPPAKPKPTPVTAVTPSNTDTAIPVENNDVIDVTTPVDINPLPIQPDGINRIEYIFDGKLVATVKTAPYKYHLDTTKYLNGTYTLTTKTYYANGQTKSTSQKVVVKNPFGLTQLRLWMKKFAWLIILLLLVIGAGVAAWIIHRRRGNPDDDYYGDGSSDDLDEYAVPTSTFVRPADDNNAGDATTEPDMYMPQGQPSQPAPSQVYQPTLPPVTPAQPSVPPEDPQSYQPAPAQPVQSDNPQIYPPTGPTKQ